MFSESLAYPTQEVYMVGVPTVDLETCIFCELVAGKRPISVIDETEDVLAFMDIQPVNPGHVLIIPKRHAPYLEDLDSRLGGDIFAMGMRVAAALRTCGVRCEGVNLFLADREAAGQEIFHAHLHVFPRFAGDGFGLKFSPNYFVLPPRAELDDIAKGICNAMPT
jgi:histidine triad (HIT) family protein